MPVGTTTLADGRAIGFADFGPPDAVPVVWCHGGPGSRLEPAQLADAGRAAGLRLVGIDRPGYGFSTPQPGRTIADWVPDALAVADHLGIDRFITVGTSTGGAFALAVAALAPERVRGVVACCAMTDMRDAECRASMSPAHTHAVWDAPDRSGALAAAVDAHGAQGEKLVGMARVLCATDLARFTDPEWVAATRAEMPTMFAQGLEGYTDDRLADGPGWVTFDASSITCPVVVLHGGGDVIVSVAHARRTAAIVPHARLSVFEDLGHFSIIDEVIPTVVEMLSEEPTPESR